MAALSPEPREWQLDPHLEVPRAPRGEAGATPPLPQPATPGRPDPARRLGAAAPGPGRSGRGSQPRAPGRGRAAPSPAPARRSRGRSSRQRPTGRSTGCSARSWCADPGARAARGAAAGGAGARDRPGWAPAERASRRRDYLIAWSGEEQGGGAGRPHPPVAQGRGGGHCSSLRPPLAPRPPPPRAPARAPRLPAIRDAKQRTCQGGHRGDGGVGWGPLGRRGQSCLPTRCTPH